MTAEGNTGRGVPGDAETPQPSPLVPHDSSIWPAVLAAGLTIAFFGLITTSWSFCILGVLAAVLGLGGWVGELCHAHEYE